MRTKNNLSQTPKSDNKSNFLFTDRILKATSALKSIKMGDTMSTGGMAINNKFEMGKTVT